MDNLFDSDTEETVPVAPAEKKKGRGAPKGKRTPTPLQLEMLAKARAKANEIRKQQKVVKEETYEELVSEIQRFEPDIKLPPNVPKPVDTVKEWSKEFKPPRGMPPPDLPNPCESIVTPDEIKKKKKTRIIIEQSSSDEDVFENTDEVIFVKRRGRKDNITPKVAPDVTPPVNPYAHSASGVAAYGQSPSYANKPPQLPMVLNSFNKRFY